METNKGVQTPEEYIKNNIWYGEEFGNVVFENIAKEALKMERERVIDLCIEKLKEHANKESWVFQYERALGESIEIISQLKDKA